MLTLVIVGAFIVLAIAGLGLAWRHFLKEQKLEQAVENDRDVWGV